MSHGWDETALARFTVEGERKPAPPTARAEVIAVLHRPGFEVRVAVVHTEGRAPILSLRNFAGGQPRARVEVRAHEIADIERAIQRLKEIE